MDGAKRNLQAPDHTAVIALLLTPHVSPLEYRNLYFALGESKKALDLYIEGRLGVVPTPYPRMAGSNKYSGVQRAPSLFRSSC